MAKQPKSTTTNVALAPAPIVDLAVNLHNDDVTAIAVSTAEERLIEEQERLVAQDKALSAEISALAAACSPLADEEARAYCTRTGVAGAIDALVDTVGVSQPRTVHGSVTTHNQADRTLTIRVTLRDSNDTASISVDITVIRPMSDQLAAKYAELDELIARQKACTLALYDVKKKRADLPRLERRVRALMAERHMSQTQEGRDLLAALNDGLDSNIRLLGR